MRCSSRLVVVLMSCAAALAGSSHDVVAQEPTKAATEKKSEEARWPVGRTITSHSAHQRRIYAELEKPATHEFKNVSLKEIAKWLEERINATVIVEELPLTVDGIDINKPLKSVRLAGRSLRTELAASLAPQRLQLVVRDDAVWITSFYAAAAYPEVRLYQVHDLVVADSDDAAMASKLQELADLVRSQVDPESWGGRCELMGFEAPGVLALVVSQTAATHEKIESLLNDLRLARLGELRAVQDKAGEKAVAARIGALDFRDGMAPPPNRSSRGKVIFSQSENERRLRDVLRQPTTFDFQEVSLGEIAEQLEAKHEIGIDFDEAALIADGKDRDTVVTFHWNGGSLGLALRSMLDWYGITYVIRNDAICLTTKPSEEEMKYPCIYQVHDLLLVDASLLGRRTSFAGLQDLITSFVVPDTWRDGTGPPLTTAVYEASGLQVLAIRERQSVHEEITALLDLLRDAFEPKVYEAQRRRPVVMPEQPQQPGVRGMGGGF